MSDQRVPNGVVVGWWERRPPPLQSIRRRGQVLAFLPAGTSARATLAYLGINHPHLETNDVSKVDRYLVEVRRPIVRQGIPPIVYLTPAATIVEGVYQG